MQIDQLLFVPGERPARRFNRVFGVDDRTARVFDRRFQFAELAFEGEQRSVFVARVRFAGDEQFAPEGDVAARIDSVVERLFRVGNRSIIRAFIFRAGIVPKAAQRASGAPSNPAIRLESFEARVAFARLRSPATSTAIRRDCFRRDTLRFCGHRIPIRPNRLQK
ncbi:MAG: hypothetical protein IPJ30_08705 [Acidobacteria bacterium]|nr:hypothetical protein [Acidobacteriota bacterium]